MSSSRKLLLLMSASLANGARMGGREVSVGRSERASIVEGDMLDTAEHESISRAEAADLLPQKFRIPAVVDEGWEMTFRDPISIQLLQAGVPKGVSRGEFFFVWVRQPENPDGRATVVKTEAITNDFVPLAEPVLEVENKEVNSISLGLKDQALIPDLVPPKGGKYVYEMMEEVNFKDSLADGSKFTINQKGVGQILRFKGKSKSSFAGHSTVRAFNQQNKTVFKMRMPRHNWLPGRWTWRLLAPNGTEPLFTLTKSMLGTGALFLRSVWHIYKGRKRDGQLVYFCKSDYLEGFAAGKTNCYSSSTNTQDTLATLVQRPTIGAYSHSGLIPDEYSLEIAGGQDAALILAWAVLHDYTKDHMPFASKVFSGAYLGAHIGLAFA